MPTIKKTFRYFQILIVNCIFSGILISNPANAAIIYDQPATLPGGLISDGRGIYDDFQLGSDFILTRFEWTGGVFGLGPVPTPPPLLDIFGGIAEDDSSGQPDGSPLTPTLFFDPTAVLLASPSPEEVYYRYSVDLITPVILEADQRYWLGINGNFPSDIEGMEWQWAFGAGGNNHALVFEGVVPRTPIDADFSFTLIGSPIPASVPEPNILLLLGIGLVAFHFSRSR